MKFSRLAIAALLAGSFAMAALPAPAQVTTGAPITVKVKTKKPRKPKMATFKGEVIHMDAASIMVRDPNNSFIVHTFTYSDALKKKLKNLIARGGYQFGDRVQIKYAAGSTVAEQIKGKPSKPF